jgi:alkylated DNA nucleotide flippase Atl1
VLDVVDRIPPGKVMTYGDVAELMGRGSPRTVGAVLSEHGREVPWQRVVQASGRPAEPHVQEALERLRAMSQRDHHKLATVAQQIIDEAVRRAESRHRSE